MLNLPGEERRVEGRKEEVPDVPYRVNYLDQSILLNSSTILFIFSFNKTLKVPMRTLSEAKREYGNKDLQDWAKYRGIQFQFTSHFPIRSILPLRVTLANTDDRIRQTMCEW